MLGCKVLLACFSITIVTQAQGELGCCYTIGYAAYMEPCCLKTETKGQSDCLSRVDLTVGGKTGWNPTCPSSAKEAGEWLTGLQANPINCPRTRPRMGDLCTGSQECKYAVRECPDGEQLYSTSTQCSGKSSWAKDAHVCLDGTTHYQVHALCVNGEWVVSEVRLKCQDCLANLQTLGDTGSCALATKGDADVDSIPDTDSCIVDGRKHKNTSADFDRLESLVSSPNLHNYTKGNYSMFVLTSGGTIHEGMFGGDQSKKNGSMTLLVFNTRDPITITSSGSGRHFGPSILAPFSDVTLQGRAGHIDGCVIAKSFKTDGKDADGLKLHGHCYLGPLCPTKPFPPKPAESNMWMWIVGAAAGAAAAGITLPLALGAVHYPTTPPPSINPCAPVGYVQKSYMEDTQSYKLGRQFGKTWACVILFAFASVVVVMSFAVAKYRYQRQRHRSVRDAYAEGAPLIEVELDGFME